MTKKTTILLLCGALCVSSAFGQRKSEQKFINDNTAFAASQTELMLKELGDPNGKYPRTINKAGELVTTGATAWTSGFFPGSLWYLYELTGDKKWEDAARKWTSSLESSKTFVGNHDIGFIMYCSYGNAERLSPQPEYKDILVQSARSLLTRYNETVGAIKSWNSHRAQDGETVGQFPVIIDNMMNLELLFYAYRVTGEQKFYDVAVSHANKTLKNHIRDDYGTYHVVNYDPETGEVVYRKTHQGYSDNSTWARGQAWAIYGFTMMYRETGDQDYLNAAINLAEYFIARLPQDMIPLWDFNVGDPEFTPGEKSYARENPLMLKDVSAAAIAASALFELAKLSYYKKYSQIAYEIILRLSSSDYTAPLGHNGNFILLHSVGSLPHNVEVDVPLVYADYYYLEAIKRYRDLVSKK